MEGLCQAPESVQLDSWSGGELGINVQAMNAVGARHFANILFCLALKPAFHPKISSRATPPGSRLHGDAAHAPAPHKCLH